MDLAVPLHLNQTNWKQKFDKNGSDGKKAIRYNISEY